MEGNLYIAEILYKNGEVHYRYSRKLSRDSTKWIRQGLFTEYYPGGGVASTGLYENGLETGHWTDYHPNGKIAAEGEYAEGRETGKWIYYDRQGNPEGEEDFD